MIQIRRSMTPRRRLFACQHFVAYGNYQGQCFWWWGTNWADQNHSNINGPLAGVDIVPLLQGRPEG